MSHHIMQSFGDTHLGCFQSEAINIIAMHISLQGFFRIYVDKYAYLFGRH